MTSPSHATLRHLLVGLVACLAVGLIATAGPGTSANETARWATVESLVHDGDHVIGSADGEWPTIDAFARDGRIYSSKPPLLSTIVAGGYWLVSAATGWTLAGERGRVVRALLLLVNGLPLLLYLVYLRRILDRVASRELTRTWVLAAAGLGTLVLPFLASLNNHVPAAFCVLFAVHHFLRAREAEPGAPGPRIAACGFFAGLAGAFDPPASLLGLGLGGVLVARHRLRGLGWFLAGTLLPLVAFFWTTWLGTGGSWLPVQIHAPADATFHPYWQDPTGIDALDEPWPVYLFHLLLGHHGLFLLTPAFGLAVAGLWTAARDREVPLRTLTLLGWATTGLALAFYVAWTSNYGGISAGFRWGIWFAPVWLLAAVPFLEQHGEQRWVRWVAGGLLGLSIGSALAAWGAVWEHPWTLRWGLFEL